MKFFKEIEIVNRIRIDFKLNGFILHISKIEKNEFGNFALYSGKEYVAFLSRRVLTPEQVETIEKFMKGENEI